jgi:hypothetical protein
MLILHRTGTRVTSYSADIATEVPIGIALISMPVSVRFSFTVAKQRLGKAYSFFLC